MHLLLHLQKSGFNSWLPTLPIVFISLVRGVWDFYVLWEI